MGRGGRSISWLALGLVLASSGPSCEPSELAGSAEATDTLDHRGLFGRPRGVPRRPSCPPSPSGGRRETGRDVRFEESYNGSGAQTRAIASGFDADIAVLSLEGDMDRLVKAGLVKKDWNAGPDQGDHHAEPGRHRRTATAIPKEIHDWADLARPGVGVLYPDPKTSGGARWNINGDLGRGAARRPEEARSRRRPRPAGEGAGQRGEHGRSGRQSMATFERGTGDAVVTYENELLLRKQVRRQADPLRHPPRHPPDREPRGARRDLDRPPRQPRASPRRSSPSSSPTRRRRSWPITASGRSTRGSRRPTCRPLPPRLFTIRDLGGWPKVKKTVFDPGGVWDSLFTRRAGGK